jgi:protein tyrosine/serine phosphatase
MAEKEQMAKKKWTGGKSLRCLVVLVLCAVVAFAGLYLARTYGPRVEPVVTNERAETKANAVAQEKWAQRLELAGVPNFHKVSDDLYRGAQPSAEGMRELKKLGIKTIVNLRSFHSDRDEIGDANLAYEHITMKPWHAEDKEVVRFLKIVSDANRAPVFVHCMRGADRTGTMCAIYRAAVQGWSKTEAIEEMTKGGFGFHEGWENIVNYVLKLDMEEMRGRAGLQD